MYHRITVESIAGRRPVVYEPRNRQAAEEQIEQAKSDPTAWHIVHRTQQSLESPFVIRLSLYRSRTSGWYAVRGEMLDTSGATPAARETVTSRS